MLPLCRSLLGSRRNITIKLRDIQCYPRLNRGCKLGRSEAWLPKDPPHDNRRTDPYSARGGFAGLARGRLAVNAQPKAFWVGVDRVILAILLGSGAHKYTSAKGTFQQLPHILSVA